MNKPNKKREIVVRYVIEGIVVLSYFAQNFETDKDGKNGEWKDVEISRDEFRAMLLSCEYRDKLVRPCDVQQWVEENSAPSFLRQGDWFINTFPKDRENPEDPVEPSASMWCLHGKIFISSVRDLPGHVMISQVLQPALAWA
jgi:hypothetical protein